MCNMFCVKLTLTHSWKQITFCQLWKIKLFTLTSINLQSQDTLSLVFVKALTMTCERSDATKYKPQ